MDIVRMPQVGEAGDGAVAGAIDGAVGKAGDGVVGGALSWAGHRRTVNLRRTASPPPESSQR